jgi:hypothetical protein
VTSDANPIAQYLARLDQFDVDGVLECFADDVV